MEEKERQHDERKENFKITKYIWIRIMKGIAALKKPGGRKNWMEGMLLIAIKPVSF